MNLQLNSNQIILIIAIIGYIIFFLMMRITINKFSSLDEIYRRNNRRLSTIVSLVNSTFEGTFKSLREIKDIRQNIIIDKLNEQLSNPKLKRIEQKEIKRLSKKSVLKRKAACTYLGLIGSDGARLALEKALLDEMEPSVKIYISNALTDIQKPSSLKVMIDALIDSNRWYRERAISNILDFGFDFQPYFIKLIPSRDFEHIELNLKYACENFNEDTKKYLFDFVDHYEVFYSETYSQYLQYAAKNKRKYKLDYLKHDFEGLLEFVCRTLSVYYYLDFNRASYLNNKHSIIKTNAFWALSKNVTTDNFKILIAHLSENEYEKAMVSVLTKMIEVNPRLLYVLEEAFEKEQDEAIKTLMAQVFSNRIEYYILKLTTRQTVYAKKILSEIIRIGKINELIGFMNLNKNVDIENILVEIIKETVKHDSEIGIELRTYLNEAIVVKCGYDVYKMPTPVNEHKKDKKLMRVVALITVIGLLIFPLIFFFRRYDFLLDASNRMILKQYVIDFNYLLAYYSIAINLIYLSLLVLSYVNVKKQAKLWNYKNISMLFRNKMIPSISIIAPAYNEGGSIVASTGSLLNLKYPNYELIVVNDGSKDDTLNRLIEAFKLIRVDYQFTMSLNCAPIRGIYRNPSLPKLVVIDKSNGGKADALNAGINVANKEYFCGIDADSMLEPEALLRLASLTLDESTETPALGGNICPINDCVVDKGSITEIRLPKSHLARFQTIEYLRAFMAGRLGWQQINSLLIISGAFGLFRKERVIKIGGYLTSRGQYQKDTVGEDMELVVRISRLMHEMKQDFKILYAFNANCWTEVPEDLKGLRTQRFRWHRGLIDILFFHKKMLFKPRYKTTGMVALPYFLIFEAIGPMIEIQGYLMVVLAAILGILNQEIAILLFITTVLMGVLVSMASILISEREEQYYKFSDIVKLMFYAIIENFGPRQLISFWRIHGQFKVIFGRAGWGQIKRKGIKS